MPTSERWISLPLLEFYNNESINYFWLVELSITWLVVAGYVTFYVNGIYGFSKECPCQ